MKKTAFSVLYTEYLQNRGRRRVLHYKIGFSATKYSENAIFFGREDFDVYQYSLVEEKSVKMRSSIWIKVGLDVGI